MVDFAGWSMPVQYTSIVDEHQAVRRAAGVFDVSHMGRLRFDGQDAGRFLDRVLTRRVIDLPLGKVRYSLVTNEQGGILDDILVSQLETPSGRRYYLLVVNAGNRDKIVAWFRSLLTPADGDVEMADRTVETAMIAIQGPQSVQILKQLVKVDLDKISYYTGVVIKSFARPCTVTRTGYTGGRRRRSLLESVSCGPGNGAEACWPGGEGHVTLRSRHAAVRSRIIGSDQPVPGGAGLCGQSARPFVRRRGRVAATAGGC
jgi:glycine cleavage system aminomethyltransferase T